MKSTKLIPFIPKYSSKKAVPWLIGWIIAIAIWPFTLCYVLIKLAARIKDPKLRKSAFVGIAILTLFSLGAWAKGLSTSQTGTTTATNVQAPAQQSQQTQSQSTPQASPAPEIGKRTKSSGCVITNALPDKACTPGAIFSSATKDVVCKSGYSSSVRSVDETTKNAVFAEYGIVSHPTGSYEVDHLISLELGGSNDISNLWPEAANPVPGFHQKDGVENSLHDKVCSGAMPLITAQEEIADNWLSVYNGKYTPGTGATATTPTITPTTEPTPSPSAQTTQVVKLSDTGICHAPGDAYYDRTTNFTPYPTMDACVAAGGRPSEK